MKPIYLLYLIAFCCNLNGICQSYTSYLTPLNAQDIEAQPQFGVCLMGGAGESDPAMIWFLQHAGGGDVLVLRASGSNGYNNYMYSELGVNVNSVETIVFHDASAANDPYVIDKVNKAEAIWFAGGDQSNYVDFWRGTAIEDGINNLINVKHGPVGGLSAGMAILGQAYFTAQEGSITQEEALANPFAPEMIIGYDDFLEIPFLTGVITETHFNDPDRIRYGRIFSFMARLGFDQGIVPFGLAANEYCAITIDDQGEARAFGEYPVYDNEFVYFLQANCENPETPEIIEPNQALTWNRGGEAVKVYKVPARLDGSGTFNLNSWAEGTGGTWENWYAELGELHQIPDINQPDCVLHTTEFEEIPIKLFPNPARDNIHLSGLPNELWTYEIYDLTGRKISEGSQGGNFLELNVQNYLDGLYTIVLRSESASGQVKFVIVD